MFRCNCRLLLAFSVFTIFGSDVFGGDAPTGAAQSVKRIVRQFDKGNPGWKVRMASLVQLAKYGPAAGSALADALKTGSPSAREFAAQALAMFAEPSARPALEQALSDPMPTIRIYALRALRNYGPLEPTERYEKMASDPDRNVRASVRSALDLNKKADAVALRKAWAGYDVTKMSTARVGAMAPDFTLTSFASKTVRLSDFRGKKPVVLRYLKLDY